MNNNEYFNGYKVTCYALEKSLRETNLTTIKRLALNIKKIISI